MLLSKPLLSFALSSLFKMDESSGDPEDEAPKLRTVFLSNLDFEVNEDKIVEVLGKRIGNDMAQNTPGINYNM